MYNFRNLSNKLPAIFWSFIFHISLCFLVERETRLLLNDSAFRLKLMHQENPIMALDIIQREKSLGSNPQNRVGQGGSGISVYPKKILQNTQKYPKFIQIYPHGKGRYTLYLKFKESDIPNTRI